MLSGMSRTCSIDADPKKNDFIARRHLEGHSPTAMERLAREAGFRIKRETISRHISECLGVTASPKEVAAVAVEVSDHGKKLDGPAEDVAVLVQQQVVQKLKDGEARVTVQHGLQAQQLLDRRAERAKDRELAITLARLLHTAPPPPAAILARPVDVVEGEAVEVIDG